jgi:Domain of unknown function (DUF397)
MVLLRGGQAALNRARDPPAGWSGYAARAGGWEGIVAVKPTWEELGVDAGALEWQRSGEGDGVIEVAFVHDPAGAAGDWVLVRLTGDPNGRVLAYDRHEWECFLDGVKKGEFDDGPG